MSNIQSSLPMLLLNGTFSVLLAVPVQAATSYYVATNGNDSNPGTQDLPFATLRKAVEKVSGGDTVNVRGGTYYLDRGLWIGKEKSGTASARTVFQSYPGEKAILDGSNLPKQNSSDASNPGKGEDGFVISAEYVDIKGFEIRKTTRTGINVWGGKHIQILNNTVHDIKGSGIYMGYNGLTTVTDILVDGNQVYNTCLVNNSRSKDDGWPSAISSSGNGNIRVTNNKAYNNYGEGIGFIGSGALISGNTVYDNFSVEIYLDNATNSTVEKNLIYTTNNSQFYRFNQPASGIQLANESDVNKLDNNKIINNIAIGGREGFSYYSSYGFSGGLKNTVIANNTFYQATGTLLLIQPDAGHTNTVITNNIFYQTNSNPIANIVANPALGFRNNLWYGGNAGFAVGVGDVNANPQLVNPGTTVASDYKLKAGSLAIDTGITLSQVNTDYAGANRPSGNGYDIGAYEY